MTSPFVSFQSQKPRGFYKGMPIKADASLHEAIEAAVQRAAQPGASVLDYGAGAGALSQRLADLGYGVLAVDLDAESYEAAVPFHRLDFNDHQAVREFISHEAGKHDVVLGIEVIEHVENPWQYIRDLAALTRPGGHVVVSTPNVTSWISRVNFLRYGRLYQFMDYDRAYGHINPVAQDELFLIFAALGLNVRSIEPGGWLPRLWLSSAPSGLLINLLGFLMSFMMKGAKEGWCIIAVAQKPVAPEVGTA